MPVAMRADFNGTLPSAPEPLEVIYADVTDKLYPYALGNFHPRFWAWYMGADCPNGALADFLAVIDDLCREKASGRTSTVATTVHGMRISTCWSEKWSGSGTT